MAESSSSPLPSAEKAISIWHRLIPGAALTFHTVVESLVDRFDDTSMQCTTRHALWARTLSFLAAWVFGLSVMQWTDFSHGHILVHGAVNVIVVTAWLLAISQYPLVCWAGHSNSVDYDLTSNESHSIGLTRLTLVAVMEAATALEMYTFATATAHEQPTSTRSTTSPAAILESVLPSEAVRKLGEWYHTAWRRHIPGVALTLQATLASGVEAAYGSDASCTKYSPASIWRTVAFVIAWGIGSMSMCGTVMRQMQQQQADVDGRSSAVWMRVAVRVALTFAWLLSVSEVPLQCWMATSGTMIGVVRLIMTAAVILLAGLTERLDGTDEEAGTASSTQYGTIA